MVLRIDTGQRRVRLGVRHRLAPGHRATDPVDVARSLVALHGTDPSTVYLSAAARLRTPDVAHVEDALYEQRALLRMLGMRRTMFVVPVEVAPVVQSACTAAIAVTERRKLLQHLAQANAGDDAWLTEVEEATIAALDKRGSATAAQLVGDEPRLRTPLLMAEGKAYQAVANITTRVLMGLSARGHIVRGRPRGTWTSSQYHWSPMAQWLPGGLREVPTEAARVELARQWLSAYGPGTEADLKWWTGWTMGNVKSALNGLDTTPVELDGGVPGVVLTEDADDVPDPGPWIALLPALDPTVMGWTDRGWYLGDHAPALFDRSGNPGPTVWCDGRIVGGWAQRPGGDIAVRLLEDVGAEARAAIDRAAADLGTWLGPIRVTPRFRTPLERELAT